MRVSLFGLYPRQTNLMNLTFGFIQLVLAASTYNTFNICYITCYACARSVVFYKYSYSSSESIYCPLPACRTWTQHVTFVHVCFSVHGTWHSFYIIVGLLSWKPLDLHVQSPNLGVLVISCCWLECAAEASRSSRPIFFDWLSRFLSTSEHLPVLYLINLF